MRIGIFGAGGIGGYLGARLARAGVDVFFIERGEHLRVMRESGLRVLSLEGNFHLDSVTASDSPADAGRCDAIFMAVKTWQLDDAARHLGPMIGPHTLVIPLQNGVDAVPTLAARLGERHLVAGLARLLSERPQPGVINHFGLRGEILIGELDNRRSERLAALRNVLIDAGINCTIPADIHVALWEKFVAIVGWGGPASLARAPLGALRSVAESRALIAAGMHEVADVGRARGIALDSEVVERKLAVLDGLPAAATNSLQRDFQQQRPSELDALCGALIRLGREVGVPTPVAAFCHAALLPLELRARGQLDFAANHPHY